MTDGMREVGVALVEDVDIFTYRQSFQRGQRNGIVD